ncbi:MAG: hypothetical protein LBN71_01695, partial [Tannerella sp.]|nr:hypothetical protein [Tannerella sp.]
MKRKIYSIVAVIVIFTSCNPNKESQTKPHLGGISDNAESVKIEIDSYTIDVFNTSGEGNFFMMDSIIHFADYHYAKIYGYGCNSGEVLFEKFGLGGGPEDIGRFMYATPVLNDTLVFILDGNIRASFFRKNGYTWETKQRQLDFGTGPAVGEYDSTRAYSFLSMTEFGVNVYNYQGKLLIPVQPVVRFVCG